MTAAQERGGLFRWYEMMMACYKRLPLHERVEFLIWDDNREPGQRTSDWPGWFKYIGEIHPIGPSVKDRRGKILPEVRTYVFDRDGHACVKCRAVDRLTLDHIIPVSKGGTDDVDNLGVLCLSCNSRKGNRDE